MVTDCDLKERWKCVIFSQFLKRNKLLDPHFLPQKKESKFFMVVSDFIRGPSSPWIAVRGMNGTVDDPLEKQWHIGRIIQRNISKFNREDKVVVMSMDMV